MGVIPLSQPTISSNAARSAAECEARNFVRVAAAGTLLAGGMLLLAGQRRAGLVAAASGTALALLDQKETLRSWWNLLPGFIDDVQRVLGQVQGGVEDIASKRETLRQILAK
ncbi:MAG: hypothetical protein ABSC88_02630 [Terracidiphilus sp.]